MTMRMRRLTFVLLGLLLLSGCSKSGGNGGFFGGQQGKQNVPLSRQPSSPAQPQGTSLAKNPGTGAGTSGTSLPPDQMLQALSGFGIQDNEVPQGFLFGFSELLGKSKPPDAEMTRFKAVGRVEYNTRRSGDEYNPLTYVVLPTEVDATAYQQQATPPNLKPGGTFQAAGIAEPVRCVRGNVLDDTGIVPGGNAGGSACLARAGIVVVIGTSQLPGRKTADGDDKNAIAVTMLGLNHLPIATAWYAAHPPATAAAATPSPSPTPSPLPTVSSTPPPTPTLTSSPTAATTQAPVASPSVVVVTVVVTVVATPPPTQSPPQPTQPPPPALTGQDAYRLLLGAAVNSRELPPGFSAATVSPGNPDQNDRRFAVVGEVDVDVRGPDSLNLMVYTVFHSPGDAQAAMQAQIALGQRITPAGPVPPGTTCIGGSGGAGTYGYSSCLLQKGNIYMAGYSRINGVNRQRGNDTSAAALISAAATHLDGVLGGSR